MIVTEGICLDDIVEKGEDRYNSNNHHEIRPVDYYDRLRLTEASKWIGLYHNLDSTPQIVIGRCHLGWLMRASAVCAQTGRFSDIFKEELEDLHTSHKHYDYFFDDGKTYFVRTNAVSLKYGFFGNIPYGDFKSIIISAVSSTAQHHPILNLDENEDLVFYLLPWQNIHGDREFRMFICDNRLTAISQQHCYNVNHTLCALDFEERERLAKRWVELLHHYFVDHIRPKFDWITDYTVDIAILDNERVYFIEANCFGKEYAAGSSLFHWIKDEDILYGRSGEDTIIYFRYVTPGTIVAAIESSKSFYFNTLKNKFSQIEDDEDV